MSDAQYQARKNRAEESGAGAAQRAANRGWSTEEIREAYRQAYEADWEDYPDA